jgi:hypothetical protein
MTSPNNVNKTKEKFNMKDNKRQWGVDKGLIAMFLKMSVDERLLANDNAVSTIKELRDAFRQRKNRKRRPKRTS